MRLYPRVCIALILSIAATGPLFAQSADLILRGGKVITVDSDWRLAEAVAVRDGRLVAIGANADVTKLAGPSTQSIDLGGRTVIPGLIDTHLHLSLIHI